MLRIGPAREQSREPGSKAGLKVAILRALGYTTLGSRKWLMSGGEIPEKKRAERLINGHSQFFDHIGYQETQKVKLPGGHKHWALRVHMYHQLHSL